MQLVVCSSVAPPQTETGDVCVECRKGRGREREMLCVLLLPVAVWAASPLHATNAQAGSAGGAGVGGAVRGGGKA
ncbi:MAG: hypothetical protein WDW38_008861 [Sanguina aurantia]